MKNKMITRNTLLSDMRFLLRFAKQGAGEVMTYTVLTATVEVICGLVSLFALPLVFYVVEHGVTLSETVSAAGMVGAVLLVFYWLSALFDGAFAESRDLFRTRAGIALAEKALTVSYQQAIDPAQKAHLHRASQSVGRHIHAPLPHIWRTFSNLIINAVGATVCAVVLWRWQWWLLAVASLSATACAVIVHIVGKWGVAHSEEEAELDARLAYTVQLAGDLNAAKDIRVFGLASWIKTIRENTMKAMKGFINRRARVYLVTDVACALLTLLQNGVAYAVLIHAAVTGSLDVSEFLLFFAAIGGFAQWIRGLAADTLTLCRELPILRDYREYLGKEELFTFDGGKKPTRGVPHTIELQNVSFSYADNDEPVLDHFDLTLKAGERLAVVGRDGIGKTTLVKMICGLLDPDEGTVLFDGIDVRTLDRRVYYALFSAVFKEPPLMNITVADMMNGGGEVDCARLWDCLEKAGAGTMVRELESGENTCISTLSAGQRQRLLLARALYKDGDILVFDEPSSALDPIAEDALYREYDRMTEGKSAVFISHRLTSTRFCDRIVYLKNGTVAEEGTHDELLKSGGEYAHLFEVQSRYYREGRGSR